MTHRYDDIDDYVAPTAIKHCWRHLCIDVQVEECDPAHISAMKQNGIPFTLSDEAVLRNARAAGRIQEFTALTRDYLPPVWAYNESSLSLQRHDPNPARQAFYENQGEPFLVERGEHDLLLPKTRYSVVEQHKDKFLRLRQEGVQGFVVTGVRTSVCVTPSIEDLLDLGFKVVVPPELTEDVSDHHRDTALKALERKGAILLPVDHLMDTALQILHNPRGEIPARPGIHFEKV